jgi:hypothetical protein
MNLRHAILLLCIPILTGCGTLVPQPQKGGGSKMTLPNAMVQMEAPQNPETPSRTTFERTAETQTVVPPHSEIREPVVLTVGTQQVVTVRTFYPSEGTTNVTRSVERHTSEIGTAQPDHARKSWGAIAALESRMKSARWMQVVGVMFLLAACAMFHPAAFVAMGGSRTIQMAVGGVGIGLVVLPMVVVGNETLLAVLSFAFIVAAAVYVFALRHGQKAGELKALKETP